MRTGAVISITVAATLAAVTAGVLAQFNVTRSGGSFFLLSDAHRVECISLGGCSLVSKPLAEIVEQISNGTDIPVESPPPKKRSDV